MIISVITVQGGFENVEVAPTETVKDLKAKVAVVHNVPLEQQVLLHEGRQLQDEQTISDCKLSDGDIVELRVRPAGAPQQPSGAPAQGQQPQQQTLMVPVNGQQVPAQIVRDQIMSNAGLLGHIRQANPQLYDAIQRNDLASLQRIMVEQDQHDRRRQSEFIRQQAIQALQGVGTGAGAGAGVSADPYDIEAQRRIEEEIRLRNVEENMQTALEYTPEAFGSVVMLYIPCVVNNVPIAAFVDSGAQTTIMSERCAEKCGIMRLVDRRFSGIAHGVGSAKIIGRVHFTPIKIGSELFYSSFTILEGSGMDFLLGLDMLRKHQACIDLKQNALLIGSQRVEFLAEKDIPKQDRLSEDNKLSISGPGTGGSFVTPTSPVAPIPPPSAAPAPATTTTTSAAPPAAVDESAVQTLVSLGFPRQAALQALQMAQGNVDLAAQLLLGEQ